MVSLSGLDVLVIDQNLATDNSAKRTFDLWLHQTPKRVDVNSDLLKCAAVPRGSAFIPIGHDPARLLLIGQIYHLIQLD